MKKLVFGLLAAAAVLAGWAEKMPPLPEGAFTFAVIPDTQSYDGEGRTTKNGRKPGTGPTRNAQLDAIVNWLVAHKDSENIRFVTHTGDITDMNNEPQWTFASKAMARLDGVLPYAVCPGNHDMKSSGDTTLFQKHFPASRYEGKSWYAESFPGFVNKAGLSVSGNNANSCCLFEGGGEKFVLINLECNAPTPVLEWAGKLLEKYADRHAIIATHQDLGAADRKNARVVNNAWGKLSKEERKTWSPDPAILGRLEWSKCHGKDGNSGLDIWKKLSSQHKNVFLVVSGDQGMIKITRVDEKGVNGNMVYSLMQDTGCGLIRIFRFVPSEKTIRCYSINPREGGEIVHEYGWWHEDKHFNFTLPWPGTATAADAPPAQPAVGALEIVAPQMGASVDQLRPVQRDFILQSKESRDKYFDGAENAKALCKDGTTPKPIGLEWKGGKGPYAVTVKRLPDGKTFFTASVASNRVEVDSLEIAREWEWTVSGGGETVTGRFKTEDLWPRLIRINGTINARDMGGMIGLDGRRVKQGLVFRSAGLNHNAPIEYYSNDEILQLHKDGKLEAMGEAGQHLAKKLAKGGKLHERAKSNGLVKRTCYAPGKVRLTAEECARLDKLYGFKSDVDLRRDDECFGMTGSPLGPQVKWWQFHDAEGKSGYSAYSGAFSVRGTNLNHQVFSIFMDPKNYPIVFHCIGGADRTGTVGLILEALLGVSEDMMWKDYLTTGFVGVVSDARHKEWITSTFAALGRTPGNTWAEKAERYFLDLGFTAQQIADLREFLLEKR